MIMRFAAGMYSFDGALIERAVTAALSNRVHVIVEKTGVPYGRAVENGFLEVDIVELREHDRRFLNRYDAIALIIDEQE
jgi:hypothetical protein